MDFVALNSKLTSRGIAGLCSSQNHSSSELLPYLSLQGKLLGCPMLRLCYFGLMHIPAVTESYENLL